MINSKLLTVIRNFNAKQLSRMENFVDSPYFNRNENVALLYKHIKKYAPNFDHKGLLKRNAYNAIFPGKAFNKKKIGYLMSDLLKLSEKFIEIEKSEERVIENKYSLLLQYNDWGLQKHYRAIMNEARTLMKESSFRDAQYYYNEFLLNAADNLNFDKKLKHVFDNSLQNAIDSLDIYYLSLKLRYSCEIMNRSNVVASEYQLRLMDEILLYLKKTPMDEIPCVTVYYHILMTFREEDNESHYNSLKAILQRYSTKFPPTEAYDLYAYTINYCIRKVNTGNHRFLGELFDIYQNMIDNGLLFVGNYLSPWTFKNIVGVALKLGEFDWAEKFINRHKENIAPKFVNNAYAYNMACLYFYKKDFDNALSMLNNVEFNDIFYILDSKAMMLCVYLELEEIDLLYSLIDSFSVYLKRNKLVSDYHRKLYQNLIRFIRELLKIGNWDKEKAKSLKVKLESEKQTAYSSWLKQKINALINEKSQ